METKMKLDELEELKIPDKINGFLYPDNPHCYYGSINKPRSLKNGKISGRIVFDCPILKNLNKRLQRQYSITASDIDEFYKKASIIKKKMNILSRIVKWGLYKPENDYYLVYARILSDKDVIIKVDKDDLERILKMRVQVKDKDNKYHRLFVGEADSKNGMRETKLQNFVMNTDNKVIFKNGDILDFRRNNLEVINGKEQKVVKRKEKKQEHKEQEEKNYEEKYSQVKPSRALPPIPTKPNLPPVPKSKTPVPKYHVVDLNNHDNDFPVIYAPESDDEQEEKEIKPKKKYKQKSLLEMYELMKEKKKKTKKKTK